MVSLMVMSNLPHRVEMLSVRTHLEELGETQITKSANSSCVFHVELLNRTGLSVADQPHSTFGGFPMWLLPRSFSSRGLRLFFLSYNLLTYLCMSVFMGVHVCGCMCTVLSIYKSKGNFQGSHFGLSSRSQELSLDCQCWL